LISSITSAHRWLKNSVEMAFKLANLVSLSVRSSQLHGVHIGFSTAVVESYHAYARNQLSYLFGEFDFPFVADS